jgi:hypothetical protein
MRRSANPGKTKYIPAGRQSKAGEANQAISRLQASAP